MHGDEKTERQTSRQNKQLTQPTLGAASSRVAATPTSPEGADNADKATQRPRNHVFLIDGTLSSMAPGRRTHVGRLRMLLTEGGPSAAQSVGYHPGVQGAGWRKWWNAATGEGLNDAILEGYGAIASRYRPGDRIFLFGFSRGAYAARSLAGLIARIGLLRQHRATERRIKRAFAYYQAAEIGAGAHAFRRTHCHEDVEIDFVGVWDTVAALGPPYPALSYLGGRAAAFHDAELGPHIKAGRHALALDEDRYAFRPVLWRDAPSDDPGRVQQVWFPGSHGDVGGEVDGDLAARPLGHAALVWMLSEAEALGLKLPPDWRRRFPVNACAPSIGSRRGVARLFLLRGRRSAALCSNGQRLHGSVAARIADGGYRPHARLSAAPCAAPTDPARMSSAAPVDAVEVEAPISEIAYRTV